MAAIRQTICQNECAHFIFWIQHRQFVDTLQKMSLDIDATIEVYMVAAPLTMSHLFRSATKYFVVSPAKYFVVSTGDVSISSLSHLGTACNNSLSKLDLMVVSRRDNATNADAITSCLKYRDILPSPHGGHSPAFWQDAGRPSSP